MTGHSRHNMNPDQPIIYQIRLRGQLGPGWTDWFEGLAVTLEEGDTLLTGPVTDQPALHGLLKKVRDLGLPLVSVCPSEPEFEPCERKERMDTYRKTAVIVGCLYILGTVAGILSVVFSGGILDAPDYLTRIAANENQIITGAVFVLTMGLALAIIPAAMFPILKRHNEGLAAGYVIFRGGLETITYIGMTVCWLLLILLSKEYIKAGTPDGPSLQTLGAVIQGGHDSIQSILEIVFPMGALMFYSVLYQSKLIPRWISGWGLAAALLWLAVGVLGMIHLIDLGDMSTIQVLLSLPIFLQEMVMAVWLIARGFNPAAIASVPSRQLAFGD